MAVKTRIQRLEKKFVLPIQNPFQFRVAGRRRRDCQLELIARTKALMADPRLTAEQRARLAEGIKRVEAALEPE